MSKDSWRPNPQNDGDQVTGSHSKYDWTSISPSTAVVETVADTIDMDSTDLDSLYGSLDPDALDTLVQQPDQNGSTADITISFTFADTRVTVHSAGDVVVEP